VAGRYDVIVLGIGGMGSATAYHLARRGKRVLGLERFQVPHEMGSSHGLTRIIRLAYYEHPGYVPLLRRSYELWRELQQAAGEQLLYITGSIDAGEADGEVVQGSLLSCKLHDLPHELLSGVDLARRFPGYLLPADYLALLQPEGGFLLPERCIVSHATAARELGAEIRTGEQVLDWEPRADGVAVMTEQGEYVADRLVVTAGPWASKLLPGLAALAVPERQVLGWFELSDPALFSLERFPVFNLLVPEGRYYGFPEFQIPGLKIGLYHHLEEQVDPDTVDRNTHERDEQALRRAVARYFPAANGRALATKVCMFTNSPDEHFILDLHPDDPRISIAAGFSGHGFKFCSVVGEIMADLAERGDTQHDISLFRLGRFSELAASP
jgi:sarcosine oxidase